MGRSRWAGIKQDTRIQASEIGTVGELVAAATIMGQGHQVFRALSSGAPYDLVVSIGAKVYTVEVRCGETSKNCTRFSFPCRGSMADIFAVVLPHCVLFVRNREGMLCNGVEISRGLKLFVEAT